MSLMRWTGSAWTAVPGIKQYNGSSWLLSKASGWDQNVARQFASDVTNPIIAIQRILSNMHADGWNPWVSTQSTSPPLANWCQRLTITGSPTGGTFTLTYGANTTSAITFNATASTVQTALNALAAVQAIGVARVLGPAGTAYATATGNSALPGAFYTVVFPYPASTLLTANSSSLTGGSSPTVSITTTPVGGTNINWNGRWTWDGTQSGANGLNNQVNFDTNEWTDAQGGSGSNYQTISGAGNWSGYRHDTTTDITWYRALLEYQALSGDSSFASDVNQMEFVLFQNWFNTGYYKAWPYFELLRMHERQPYFGWDQAALHLAQSIFTNNYTNSEIILDGNEKFAYRVDYNIQCAAMLLDAGVRFAGTTCAFASYAAVPSYTHGTANSYQTAAINVLNRLIVQAVNGTTGLIPTTLIYIQGGTDSDDTSGNALKNRVQNITMSGTPTGGTYTLTFGANTTSTIAYNATASTVQIALNVLASVTSAGGLTVVSSGSGVLPAGYTYSVSFTAATSQSSLITANASGLTGGSSPSISIAAQVFEANIFCKSGETGQDADYLLRAYQYLQAAGLTSSSPNLLSTATNLMNVAFGASGSLGWYDSQHTGLYFGLNWDGSGLNTVYKESGRQWHWLKAINRMIAISGGNDASGTPWITWRTRFLSAGIDYAWLNQEKALGPVYRSNPNWTPYSDPNTPFGGSPADQYKISSYTTEFWVTSEACGIVSGALLDYLLGRGSSPW